MNKTQFNLADISAWCSIIGFIISIITIILTARINGKINKKFQKYKNRKKFNASISEWKVNMNALYDLIKKDGLSNEKIKADILKIIVAFEEIQHIVNKKDKKKIKEMKKMLSSKDNINNITMYDSMAYFIARFDQKEEEII